MESCLICKEESHDLQLSCSHFYHKNCLSTWLSSQISYKCVYCQKQLEKTEIPHLSINIDIDPYEFVKEIPEGLSENEKFIIKNLYDTGSKLLDDILYYAYNTEYNTDRKKEIIEYCIDKEILIPPNDSKKNNETFLKEINEFIQVTDYCKGHLGKYSSECSVFCSSCNKWICSCNGFYHCCCYLFRGNPII